LEGWDEEEGMKRCRCGEKGFIRKVQRSGGGGEMGDGGVGRDSVTHMKSLNNALEGLDRATSTGY
jgi:hypothetical protein